MTYLVSAFLLFTAYLAGCLIKKIFRDPDQKLLENFILGMLLMFLLWEMLILPSIKLLASFAIVSKVYSVLLLAIALTAILFCGKEMRNGWMIRSVKMPWMALIVVMLFLLQTGYFIMMQPDVAGDFTVETVNTTIQSDLIYENHPGMGDTFTYGITFRGKLVTLPLFYAYLTNLFSCHAVVIVYRAIPTFVLLLSYMAYGLWADVFFGKAEHREAKTALFYGGITLLNFCGSLSENSMFYYQLHKGFRGETIVFSILIPYAVYLCWQIYGNKKYRSIIYLIMTGIGTLTLTDYQKGFVPLFMTVIICSLVAIGYKVRRWLHCRS